MALGLGQLAAQALGEVAAHVVLGLRRLLQPLASDLLDVATGAIAQAPDRAQLQQLADAVHVHGDRSKLARPRRGPVARVCASGGAPDGRPRVQGASWQA
jgi:hypothetical protein